jgi:integrase
MARLKLTKRVIDDIQPGDKDAYYWDTDVTGLALKVTPKGRKTFFVQYRAGGRGAPTRKYSLGKFGETTLHKAKGEATRILGLRAEGRDPAEERQSARRKTTSDNFAEIAEDFLTKHASQNRTVDETTRILKRDVLPAWGKRSVHQIGKRDVNDLLDAAVDRGSPIMANRTLAAVRKLFSWCLSRGIISQSPCDGVAAPQREKSRDRVLSDEELLSVFNTAKEIEGPFGYIIQMLILTAQRRSEISDMKWNELDLETATWTIPAERTKNEKPHFVHLSTQAKEVLSAIAKTGDYVFTTNGTTPFSGFSKSKKRLDELSGVAEWRIHDLRRTVTSGLAKIGIAPHVADKILNHQSGTISGVAAVYQKHEYLEERISALDSWCEFTLSLVDTSGR